MGLAVTLTPTPELAEPLLEADVDDMDDGADALVKMEPIILKLSPVDCGIRLDKVISGLVPQFSRSRIQQWIDAGHVMVDGKTARSKMTSFGDETVVLSPQPAPEDEAFKPESMALNIVYEDASIIVLDK